MKTVAAIVSIIAFCLSGCATGGQRPPKLVNGCLVEAIEFDAAKQAGAALSGENVWSKVLIVEFVERGKRKAHAYCVYLYPLGADQLWAYDYKNASQQVTNRIVGDTIDTPANIAKRLLRGYVVTQAFYL